MPRDIASDYNNHTAEKDFTEPRKLNVTLLTGFKNIKHKHNIKQNKQVIVYCRSYNKVLPTIYYHKYQIKILSTNKIQIATAIH